MIAHRGRKNIEPSVHQNRKESKSKRHKVRGGTINENVDCCSTCYFKSNFCLVLIVILSSYYSIRSVWLILHASTFPATNLSADTNSALIPPSLFINTEVRQKYFHLLNILQDQIGYKGPLFQTSLDVIEQLIQMDHISQAEMENYPIFQAFTWLAEEPFSPEYVQNSTAGVNPLDPINIMQRYSLAVLYFSTNGDGQWKECSRTRLDDVDKGLRPTLSRVTTPCLDASSGKTSRFLSHTVDECLWFGITCTKHQRIRMIDLTNNGLNGTFPLELVLLSSSLELLWLPDNPHLSGTIPDWIHHMKKLTSLSLQNTNMGGIISEQLYTLKQLETIRLQNCKFTGTVSSELGKLSKLKWMWIHENDLIGAIPDQVQLLNNLEGLSVYSNKFESGLVEKDEVCNLRSKKLEHLWVDCDDTNQCKCCSKCLPAP